MSTSGATRIWLRRLRRRAGAARRAMAWHLLRSSLPAVSPSAIERISEAATRFTSSLRCSGSSVARYRFSPSCTQPVLYASVFVVLLRHLTGDLDRLSGAERAEWVEYIRGHQCSDGLFRDERVANAIAETEDWWGWRHLTLHSLMALTALGAKPSRSLEFLAAVDTGAKVREWLSSLDWGSRVAFTSNHVQNYVTALQYARDLLGCTYLDEAIATALSGLEERADSGTGLWGDGFANANEALLEGITTGYHFWLLFWWEGRPIPYEEKVLQCLIRLQNPAGGFNRSRIFSSACNDIDGLDPLVRIAGADPSSASLSILPLKRAVRWQLANFQRNGGAVFTRASAFEYGHAEMRAAPGEPDAFSTWFRLLAVAVGAQGLALADPAYGALRFNMLDCPGLQFAPSAGQRTRSVPASASSGSEPGGSHGWHGGAE